MDYIAGYAVFFMQQEKTTRSSRSGFCRFIMADYPRVKALGWRTLRAVVVYQKNRLSIARGVASETALKIRGMRAVLNAMIFPVN